MGKKIRGPVVLFIACFIVLAGCSDKTEKEEELEKKVTELEEKIEKEKEINKGKNEQKEQEQEKPVVVSIIDPTTNNVIKSFSPADLGFGEDDSKYKAEIEAFAKGLARGTEIQPGYDQRMTPDQLDGKGNIIKGTPQIILEEAELVEEIIEASAKGGEVELPLYITVSGYNEADAASLGEVVVAKYTTYFNSSVAGRTRNIELSAEAINNIILGAGDVFSFNTTLGPSDEAHGYQPAEEIVNGKLVMGIGGGICQTSSTLFNAVDFLGVGYVEKHHHSLEVGYVPKGRDATVSYGGKDFRFKNTTGVPLLIKAIAGKGALTIEVRTSRQFEPQIKKGS